MAVSVYVPRAPARLRITQSMWEDFLCDPVCACWVIMRYRLDAFQAARLRYYWWVPDVIDSSGFSSGKTIVDWIWMNLRAILIPDQKLAAYYPTHGTGKQTFWEYFGSCPGPIYHSQIGNSTQEGEDIGDGITASGSIWQIDYRNGNRLIMPAAGFDRKAVSQASMRFNTMLVEEWTHVEASGAIDSQLRGRNTRASFNQFHPVWGNHFKLTAPAKNSAHPGYKRIKAHERLIKKGDAMAAHLHYCYKDFSNLPALGGKSFRETWRNYRTIEMLRSKQEGTAFLGEGLGIWGVNGTGWFEGARIAKARALWEERQIMPMVCLADMVE